MLRTKLEGHLQPLQTLPTGSFVDIEVCMPASSKRVKTEYVGMWNHTYLIVNYPNPKRLGAAADYVSEGTSVIVRALLENAEGQVIAFKSHIRAVSVHPVKLVFIDMPDNLECYELRTHTRIPTYIPAKFSCSDVKEACVVRDISLNGLQLEVETKKPETFKEGQKCEVTLVVKSGTSVPLTGEVRSIKKKGFQLSLGIHLTAKVDEVKKVLNEYLIDLSAL
ncbi:flagellar brake domain-containing protein [Pseudoalteromonas sp. T1lg65]|uniref:flagellar brake domain-containing protein n=1 Tax=Pseudoalteromonas sp. T1lg65 TaxID=2077101 RepID=UPI003F7B2ABA